MEAVIVMSIPSLFCYICGCVYIYMHIYIHLYKATICIFFPSLSPLSCNIRRITFIPYVLSYMISRRRATWFKGLTSPNEEGIRAFPMYNFLLLSDFWWLFEGFDDQSRRRGHCLILGLYVLNGQFHCYPQTLQSLVALEMSSPSFLGDRPRGLGQIGHWLPHQYILILLGMNFGSMVQAAGTKWTQIWDIKEGCTEASSKPKATFTFLVEKEENRVKRTWTEGRFLQIETCYRIYFTQVLNKIKNF